MSLFKLRNLLLLFVLTAFAACSEDSGPVGNPLTDPILTPLYEKVPDPDNCYEGILKQTEKDKVLARVNEIRAIHKLPAVTYNFDNDIMVQKACLILSHNEVLTHYPAKTLKCWSELGEKGCGESNLHLGYSSQTQTVKSESSVDSWVSERNSVSGLGHRRWILSPFLKTVAFGRVDLINDKNFHWSSSALHVFDSWEPTPADVEFVACPYENYPHEAFDTDLFLSFAVLADKSSMFGTNQEVSFANVAITVSKTDGTSMTVTSITNDNSGSGLTNHLQWKVSDLERNTKYNVEIKNVSVNGSTKSYIYWFDIK